MLASAIPLRFQLAWAQNAGGSFIRTPPVASQIGVNGGAASYNDGFVPLNFTQIAAGGVPPFGQDMNGVLNETTSWDIWYQAGGPIPYDTTFSTAQGGYAKDARVTSSIVAGVQWYSTVDNNTTNPDDPSTSANWARVGLPVGTPLQSFSTTLPPGFVAANGLTIGNAASNATGRGNADTLFLYAYNWTSLPNLAIFTSAGVVTTRGANPTADFAANKALATPGMQGIGLIGADPMGGTATSRFNFVPVVSGNISTPGSLVGENLHTLITGELASHTHGNSLSDPGHVHGVSGTFTNTPVGGGSSAQPLINTGNFSDTTDTRVTGITLTNAAQGGGSGHNTVHLSTIVYWGQKL